MANNTAMTAKTKAIFASRLKDTHYNQMLQKKSVSEIAAYLKNETYYAECLEGINEKALHRGQLEILIRNELILKVANILRYSDGQTKNFKHSIVVEAEINIILSAIRAFTSLDFDSVVAKLPLTIENEICFDFRKMTSVRNYDELMELLKDTPYSQIINAHYVSNIEDLDFVSLEQSLKRHFYEETLKIIDSNLSSKQQKELKELIYVQMELDNVAKIYRLKKYFNASSDKIKSIISPINIHISKTNLNKMIEDMSSEEIIHFFSQSYYHSFIKDDNFDYIEHMIKKINYQINRHRFMFSSDNQLVLLTYIRLMEIEIENIIDIIEGVRYRVPSEQIRKILVY